MHFVFLAVIAQVSNAFVLKLGELYGQDRPVVMVFNYLFAALIASAGWALLGTGVPSPATLVLGPVGGLFWAGGLFLWMGAIATAGLGMATAALRLTVIWPTLLSLLVFGELPTVAQWAGVGLTFGVLGLLAAHSLRSARALPAQVGVTSAFKWLLLTFTVNGGVGITQKLFTEWSPPEEKLALLTLVFVTAAAVSGVPVLRRRRRVRRGDLLRGFLFGVGNVTGNGLLLLGLERVPGVIAFPINSISVIALATLGGIVLWRERPGPLGIAAIVLAAAAIGLMAGGAGLPGMGAR